MEAQIARAQRKTPSRHRRSDNTASADDPRALEKQAELLDISKADWNIARRRMRFVKMALASKTGGAQRYASVARKANVSIRVLYRWIERWRRDSTLTSLMPAQRGPKAGNRRLDFERDAIIESVLDDWMSKRV